MPAPTITPLPTPPSRSQSPETFSTDADAFLGALPDFATDANAQASYLDGLATAVDADATAAVAAASIAVGAANYQGDYNAGTTYQIGESVSYSGRRYVAKTVNTGVTPADGANWFLINDGDVLGPVSASDNGIAFFDGTNGKLIKSGLGVGTAGQYLSSQGAGNLPQWVSAPTPVGLINDTFTAAGNITAGKVIQYTTGTNVEAVSGSNTVYGLSLGSGVNAGSPSNQERSRVGISPDGTTAVALVGESGAIKVRIGTISGSTVTWGTAVSLTLSGATATSFRPGQISFINGSNTDFIIVAYDGSGTTNNGIVCHFGVISGTTATFTRSVVLAGTQSITAINSVHYTTNSVCVFYLIGTTMSGIAFTFSGTTITAGSATSVATTVYLNNNDTQHIPCDFDALTTGQIVVGYNGAGSSYQVRLVRVTASGTVLSAGSPLSGDSTTDGLHDLTFDKRVANRLYHTYKFAGYIDTKTTTISGSTLTNSANYGRISPTLPNGDEVVMIVKLRCVPVGSGYPALTRLLTVYSQYSASAGNGRSVLTQELSNDTTNPTYSTVQNNSYGLIAGTRNELAMATLGKFAVMNESANSSTPVSIGQAPFTYIVTNLTEAKIIGIASETVTAGQPVKVDLLGGYNKNQTGLTPWTVYYVDVTGALTTTSTSPNVKIGKSTSATAIQIKAPTI